MKIDSGHYYQIGGYNDYQQDVAAMVREYLKVPGKGVKVPYVHRQLTFLTIIIINARQHMLINGAICYRQSVRVTGGSVKRLKLGSCNFHHRVAPWL